MAFEKFYMVDENYGRGFCLQEYNGKWYIQEAQKPKTGEGTVFKTWMSKYKPGKGEGFVSKEDGTPYRFPVGVEITEEAAKRLMGDDTESDDIPW